MKKLVTLAALMGFASLSFGQGIVSFANSTTTRISTNNAANTTAGAMASAPAGSWYYALFRAPSTKNGVSTSLDPLSDGWTLVAIGTNTTSPGRLNGNTTTEGVVVTPTAPSTDDYAVAGWSANIGSTWAAVEAFFNNSSTMNQASHDQGSQAGVAGFFGIAPTFANDTIANPTAGAINGVFGTAAGLIAGYSLTSISAVATPEPTSFALLGLGSAALLIFRRRK